MKFIAILNPVPGYDPGSFQNLSFAFSFLPLDGGGLKVGVIVIPERFYRESSLCHFKRHTSYAGVQVLTDV